MMTEVATQVHKEALPQGAGICSLSFPFSPLFVSFSLFFLTMTLSVLTGVDVGTKEPELAIAEGVKGPTPNV